MRLKNCPMRLLAIRKSFKLIGDRAPKTCTDFGLTVYAVMATNHSAKMSQVGQFWFADEAKFDFDRTIYTVQSKPVVNEQHRCNVIVVVSVDKFERLIGRQVERQCQTRMGRSAECRS